MRRDQLGEGNGLRLRQLEQGRRGPLSHARRASPPGPNPAAVSFMRGSRRCSSPAMRAARIGNGAIKARRAWRRTWPAQRRDFDCICRTDGNAELHERIAQERDQRYRGEAIGCDRECEPREPSRIAVRERHAAEVVDVDRPAPQFRGDAPRERRDRGSRARHVRRVLSGLAQREGKRERLFARIGGFDHRKAFECPRCTAIEIRCRARAIARLWRPDEIPPREEFRVRVWRGRRSLVTSPRSIPIRASNRFRPNCGCPGEGSTSRSSRLPPPSRSKDSSSSV